MYLKIVSKNPQFMTLSYELNYWGLHFSQSKKIKKKFKFTFNLIKEIATENNCEHFNV